MCNAEEEKPNCDSKEGSCDCIEDFREVVIMRSNGGLVQRHLKHFDADWVVEYVDTGYNRYHGCENCVETLCDVSILISCRSVSKKLTTVRSRK